MKALLLILVSECWYQNVGVAGVILQGGTPPQVASAFWLQ
jgi:hypothetical protein